VTRLRRILLLASLFAARTVAADCPAGPFVAGDTIRCTFNTQTSTLVTLAGTPVVSVYKDSSLTQTTTGVTLSVDFDGLTGLQHVAVDTSADGSFFAAGHDFQIVVTTGTVGGVSVAGATVGAFSLGRALTVAQIQSGLATSSAVAGVQSDTDDIQTRLPAALTGGRMDSSVGAMATDSISAAAVSAAAVTKIVSGLATAANVTAAQTVITDLLGTPFHSTIALDIFSARGETADIVWQSVLTDFPDAGTAGKKLYDIPTSSGGATAAEVWDYLTTALTTSGSVGEFLLAKLSLLTSGTRITIADPVQVVAVSIVPGTAYTGVRQPKLTWPLAASERNLTGATPKLVITDGDTPILTITGTVTGAGTESQAMEFSVTAAQSALLLSIGPTAYTYQINATWVADSPVAPVRLFTGDVDTQAKYQ
jgi:hypothetical protein